MMLRKRLTELELWKLTQDGEECISSAKDDC